MRRWRLCGTRCTTRIGRCEQQLYRRSRCAGILDCNWSWRLFSMTITRRCGFARPPGSYEQEPVRDRPAATWTLHDDVTLCDFHDGRQFGRSIGVELVLPQRVLLA